MQQPLIEAPLRVRVWRAIAIGFSVTALALNALASSLAAPKPIEARPAPAGRALRPPLPAAPAPEEWRPSTSLAPSIAAPNDETALDRLARRFSDAADADLAELAGALASSGGARARGILFTAARSSRPSSQAAALDALANLDTPDVREFMLEQLNLPAPSVAALNYFTDCREPRALPALERLARDAPRDEQSAAIASLLAQGESATPIISRLLRGDAELLDALLEAAPPNAFARRAFRQASIERLRAGAITQGRVFDFLEQDLSSEAREALLEAARDPASAAAALAALSKRGDRASVNALKRLQNDADRNLAARATCLLPARTGSRPHHVTQYYIQ